MCTNLKKLKNLTCKNSHTEKNETAWEEDKKERKRRKYVSKIKITQRWEGMPYKKKIKNGRKRIFTYEITVQRNVGIQEWEEDNG